MAEKRYTLVMMTQSDDEFWVVHKPGCAEIATSLAAGATKRLVKVDLEATDEEVLEDVDAPPEWTMEDVDLCACTGYVSEGSASEQESDLDTDEDDEEEALPLAPSAAVTASQAAARAKLLQQVEEAIDKLVVERGVDNVGEGDQWAEERLPACHDDYVYDLAVEVRKLRERGDSWWRVAHELNLPGSGASNKQGRKGSAFARRLWRAAWGKTYLGQVGTRESKVSREARAMENLGRPYFTGAEDAPVIIEKIRGQMLHWVTRLEGTHGLIASAQEAYVHDDPKYIKVKMGPRGPYVEFFEQIDPAMLLADPRQSIAKSGPLRAVYVDRITRVGV
jgi:hypothetical protein